MASEDEARLSDDIDVDVSHSHMPHAILESLSVFGVPQRRPTMNITNI